MNIIDTPRFKFNSGYHDAASDVENGRPQKIYGKKSVLTGKPWRPHKMYAQGYKIGYEMASHGEYKGDSGYTWRHRKHWAKWRKLQVIARDQDKQFFGG